jgi:excisionase family DNA binding protein
MKFPLLPFLLVASIDATANRATRRRARTTITAALSPPDMSIQDTAVYLGVTTTTVRAMIADGRLTAYRLGGRIIRLRRDEIDAALQRIGE